MPDRISIRAIVSGIIISSVILGAVSYKYYLDSRLVTDSLIARDINTLAAVFKQIDQRCTIMGFDHQSNYIDFLNVVKFIGSEVGSMNLAQPENWQGPYLNDNPTMQGKPYQIIKTLQGYFIVPGNGVKLSNGTIIGKDIVFTQESNIRAMMRDPKALLGNGNRVLAAEITLARDHIVYTPEQEQ